MSGEAVQIQCGLSQTLDRDMLGAAERSGMGCAGVVPRKLGELAFPEGTVLGFSRETEPTGYVEG